MQLRRAAFVVLAFIATAAIRLDATSQLTNRADPRPTASQPARESGASPSYPTDTPSSSDVHGAESNDELGSLVLEQRQRGLHPNVVCGMVIVPADPSLDPAIRRQSPTDTHFHIRAVQPDICWSGCQEYAGWTIGQ